MSSQTGSAKKRKDANIPVKAKDASSTGIAAPRDADLDVLIKANLKSKKGNVEWDYRVAISVITLLAFVTRFWGISHPNEVVFDEVHFGKVSHPAILDICSRILTNEV
jgi:dolichyl-phosphate-mannose-protein mannosyltransferase